MPGQQPASPEKATTPPKAIESTPLKPDGDKTGSPQLLCEPVTWIRTLVETYSWKLLTMVACTNHLLKGFVAGGGDSGLIGAPMKFIFKEYRVIGGEMQVYIAIATSPWALKPLLGLISDAVPVLGYRKLPYIFATSTLGWSAVAALGFVATGLSLTMVVVCLFLAFLMVATADLLVVAKQSAEIKDSAELGPDFILFTWVGVVVAMIASAFIAGPVIEEWSPHACYIVALPFAIPCLWPAIKNYIGEKPLPETETTFSRACMNFRENPVMFWMCLGTGVFIATLSAVTLTLGKDTEDDQAIAAIFGSCILFTAIGYFIRPEMALPLVFWFLLGACPQVDGALFYFYTNDAVTFPEGPHFSAWMYATGFAVAGMLGVLIGYLSGSVLFKSWRYTSILLLTVLGRALVRLMLVPVLLRWNHTRYRMPGVSDQFNDVIWILAVEFLASMLFAWSWIPKQVMNAQLTPKGNEATMLALTSGTFNLGSMISSYLGCWLLSSFHICPDGDMGDAEALKSLWKPYLVSVLAPVLVLILLPAFIPNKLQTEVLITEHPESCTYGALSGRTTARLEPASTAP